MVEPLLAEEHEAEAVAGMSATMAIRSIRPRPAMGRWR
jgi:hypothetical protein